jgi:CubicO group peptidase (beta-lactamase class C family)
LNASLINEFFDQINHHIYTNLHSVLIVRNNKLVVEEYFPGTEPVIPQTLYGSRSRMSKRESFTRYRYRVEYNRDTLHTLQSATKSVNSILIGIAIDQHLIHGVDEKISTFFPEFTGKDGIRLKHFLSMTAGLDWNENKIPYTDPRNDCIRMNRTNDPVRFLLERPAVAAPGTKFVYNSAIAVALGEIIRKVSGMPVDKFAERNLFKPLGISDYAWKGNFTNGVIHTGGGLYLRPRDMAKIGCMMLNNGRWQGKQIVSEDWVRESTKKQASDMRYGYEWWLSQFKVRDQMIPSFLAEGYGGQCISVFPSLHMVVVFTGWNEGHFSGQLRDMMQRYILPAAIRN